MPDTAISEEGSSPGGTIASRRVALLSRVLWAMVAMATLAMVWSFADPANDVRVTLAVYVPIYAVLLMLGLGVRRGRATLVAWGVSAFFWLIVAFITLFFGGMQGQNAACFVVVAMLVGSVISARAGLIVAVGSSAWCALVVYLELSGLLPAPIGPAYSPMNAWSAVTTSLMLSALLMRNAIESLKASHAQAAAAAKERDEVLRRSEQAQKMELVGNLASGVAHDFNNLLSVISGVSQLLRSEVRPGEAEEMLDDLDDAATHAALITRQLLALGRLQPGEPTEVDVGERVTTIAPMIQRLLGPHITIEIATAEGAVVRASQVALEQVLLNLAVNARDAMPEGGPLRIEVRIEGETVVLEVTDAGVGMDDKTRAQIFSPFFTTKAKGTGLGLVTAKEKVEQFGGTIEVRSEPGKGSTFSVRFPRVQSRPASAANEAPAPRPISRSRILLVDDDAQVRRATARVLEREGFEVVAVAHGAQALALLSQPHDFECVVSDLSMPVMDGDAMAARLAELAPRVPVVLISGNRAPIAALGPRRAFVPKPASRADLLRAIAQVCEDEDGL